MTWCKIGVASYLVWLLTIYQDLSLEGFLSQEALLLHISMIFCLDFLVCMFRHLYLTLMGHFTFIN